MKIRTEYVCPPVPARNFDWRATFDGYEGGDPCGYGQTEADAVQDLLETTDAIYGTLAEKLQGFQSKVIEIDFKVTEKVAP